MTKSEIDTYITANYEMLKASAKNINNKRGNNYDYQILISTAYIDIINKRKKIHNESILKAYLIQSINFEASKYNSKTNRENKLIGSELTGIEKEHESHIEQKYEYETKWRKIEAYKEKRKCTVDKYIQEAYFERGINTVRKFSAHFNISIPSSAQLINELKQNIRNEKV